MKKLLALMLPVLLASVFAGCVSTSSASYRSRGSTGAAWQVEGTWNQASDKVRITIDGNEVIAGKIGLFSTSKTLSGNYKNRPVSAILTKTTSFLGAAKMHCIVTIDGEMAANFDW